MRLGLLLCVPHPCRCGSLVDAHGLRSFVCKRAPGRSARHHATNDIIARAFASAGIPVTKQPQGLSRSDGKHSTVESYTIIISSTVILIVILLIIGIPSPTHSFTLGLNPSFSANPPYRSLSFFSFRIHYMDFPDCLLLGLLLSISVFLLFSFLFLHFFSCRFSAVD